MSTLKDTLLKIDGVQVVWIIDARGKILDKSISDYTDNILVEISTLLASLAFMHQKNSGPVIKLHYRFNHLQLWCFHDGETFTALIADADSQIAQSIEGL